MRTLCFVVLALGTVACQREEPVPAPAPAGKLTAQIIDSGFADAHDSYNAVSSASDGRTYYVLSSDKPDAAARMARDEVVRLLFRPGFSTAAGVTEVFPPATDIAKFLLGRLS